MFETGRTYSNINTHRSAISLYHAKVEGNTVGKHTRTRQLLKAIGNKRPPQPRHNAVWNVDQVVNYLQSLPINEALTTRQLAMKSTMLTALTAIPRASEIHKLDTKWMLAKEDHLIFQIDGTVKHSRPGLINPPIILHKFQQEPKICPVQTILDYIDKTQQWRDDQNTKVFLSNSTSHSPVTTATISTWLKETLKLAGINTNIFTPHSTRAAGSSKSRGKGMNKQTILSMGNWKQLSTWERHYYRQTQAEKHTEEFQKSILTPND